MTAAGTRLHDAAGRRPTAPAREPGGDAGVAPAADPEPETGRRFELVCVSHLWWDWVWQRPQHLMTRFATCGVPVTYVEEPRVEIGPPGEGFDLIAAEAGVRLARLWVSTDAADFRRRLDESRRSVGGNPFDIEPGIRRASLMFESELQPVLRQRVRELLPAPPRSRPLVLWLYTPVVVDFIDLLEPDLVVYDLMDDLASFRFAPKRIRDQRRELLDRADVVFAGGPSLHAAVAGERPDALLFPSGVDSDHFARARASGRPVPAALAGIDGPIAGYIGVVDERLDLALLGTAADLTPDWSWVLVGPVLKIEARTLPRRPNIHFVGQAAYDELPAWLARFDVGIMPFALNEATRSISPTKTLEYLAAGLPVVSTPVPDVARVYGAVVDIATDARAFVERVAGARAAAAADAGREAAVARLVEAGSWDAIAGRMLAQVEAALRR